MLAGGGVVYNPYCDIYCRNIGITRQSDFLNFYLIIKSMDNLYSRNPAKIVMYSTQYCSDCLRAKAFFEANNIAYVPVSLEGNPVATEFVMTMNKGFRSVPTIVFPDGTVLVEPSWQELKEKVMK
jgi:mycoredoxin